MKYLLDTCGLSELFKTIPNIGVTRWIDARPPEDIFISVITLGEIQKGIARLPESSKAQRLRIQFEHFMQVYADRILPMDQDIMLRWGLLSAKAESKGHPLPVMDSLIAATALAYGMEVVTRNVKDLERCGAKVINPWKD